MKNKNDVKLVGEIVDVEISDIAGFTIEAERKSGNKDLILVVAPEKYLEHLKIGNRVFVVGKFGSRNVHYSGKSHLQLNVYAKYIRQENFLDDKNTILMDGYLCKPPVYRKTPIGKEICDLMIACNEYDLRRTDYIPCIAWWKEAREAADFKVGDFVKIIGRIQSRIYHKKLSGDEVELRTAYEVSIGRIIKHESGSKKDFIGELQKVSE